MFKKGSNRKNAKKAASLIEDCDALVFCTGAGMGVDSGIGTFRGANAGIWPPLADGSMDFTDMSNPGAFEKDCALAWGFWMWRYAAYTQNEPHEGYHILKTWGESKPAGCFAYSSNIDGHWQCVLGDDRVAEIHGSIRYMQCFSPDAAKCLDIWPTPASLRIDIDEQTYAASDPSQFPVCTQCGGAARPNVLMFSDFSHTSVRTQAQEKRYRSFVKSVPYERICVVEVGAGTAIPSIREESHRLAHRGASLVRINLEESELPQSDLYNPDRMVSLEMGGLDALCLIQKCMKGKKK